MTLDTGRSSVRTYLRPLPLTVKHILSTNTSSWNTLNLDRAEMGLQRIRLKVTLEAESALLVETGTSKESRSLRREVIEEVPGSVVSRDMTSPQAAARTCMLEEDFTRLTLQVCEEKTKLTWSSRYRLLALLSLYKFKKLSHMVLTCTCTIISMHVKSFLPQFN